MKVSIYIATSLDGFIARKNGEIDWLDSPDNQPNLEEYDFEDYGFEDFYDSVDCVIMGANTLKTVINFNPWPYDEKRVIVLSRTISEVEPQHVDKFEIFSGHISTLMTQLHKAGHQHLYIDGGKTIQSFINEHLVTDLTITTVPVLLGDGIPLFGKVPSDIKLKLIESKSYENGYVKNTYQI